MRLAVRPDCAPANISNDSAPTERRRAVPHTSCTTSTKEPIVTLHVPDPAGPLPPAEPSPGTSGRRRHGGLRAVVAIVAGLLALGSVGVASSHVARAAGGFDA